MKKELIPYYISRAGLSLALGGLLVLTGTRFWVAGLLTAVILAMFILAPLSGRYSVHPEHGMTALRRDERTRSVNDQAGRNGFIAAMLALGGAAFYFGLSGAALIPVAVLEIILGVGILVYFVSDLLLRRT